MGGAKGWAHWKLALVIGLTILTLAVAGCVDATEDPSADGDGGATTNGGSSNNGGGGDDGGGSDDGEVGNETQPPGNQLDTRQLEQLIHGVVNDERAANNAQRFTHSQSLRIAAREYSKAMLNNGSKVQIGKNGSYEPARDDARVNRYEKHSALECDRTPGTGAENVVVTKYGRAVQQADGDRVVYSSIERLAQGIVQEIKLNNTKRSVMMNATYRYQGIGAEYNRSTATVYVTQSLC